MGVSKGEEMITALPNHVKFEDADLYDADDLFNMLFWYNRMEIINDKL